MMGEKTCDSSYNIDVVIGPHSDTHFDNHLHLWNYNCDINQSIQDQLTKLFRHLINFNDDHCRSLDTIAGRFNPEIEWSWNEDWTEYIHMSIRSDSDGDDDNSFQVIENHTRG